MRTVHHDQPLGRLRVVRREGPSHTTTPIVTDNDRLLLTKRADEAHDIGCQDVYPVMRDTRRFVTLVISPQVRNDDLEMFCQNWNLVTPGVPELGEAVKQDNEFPFSLGDIV